MSRDLNSVQLIGRLAQDPTSKHTPQGTLIVQFTVATGRRYTDSQGNQREDTEWTQVAVQQLNQYQPRPSIGVSYEPLHSHERPAHLSAACSGFCGAGHHLTLTDADRQTLESLLAKGTLPVKTFKRATALLELDRGKSLTVVAATLAVNYNTVAAWRDRYHTRG